MCISGPDQVDIMCSEWSLWKMTMHSLGYRGAWFVGHWGFQRELGNYVNGR